jgi:hypothetical protein
MMYGSEWLVLIIGFLVGLLVAVKVVAFVLIVAYKAFVSKLLGKSR